MGMNSARKELSKIFAAWVLVGAGLIGVGYGLQKGLDAMAQNQHTTAALHLKKCPQHR